MHGRLPRSENDAPVSPAASWISRPAGRELLVFVALYLAGVAGSLLKVEIPYTGAFIEGRYAAGYLGAVMLSSLPAAILLHVLIAMTWYGELPFAIVVFGNLSYSLPGLFLVRFVYRRFLSRWQSDWLAGVAWVALILFVYQAFHMPFVGGVLALLQKKPLWRATLEFWESQPFLVESLLVGIVSGAILVAWRINHRLRRSRERLDHINRVLLAIRNVNQLIVSEPDRVRLTRQACENLTETMGYHAAWIALLGGDPPRAGVLASSGFGQEFERMAEGLKAGNLPERLRQALGQAEPLVCLDPAGECPDCPLAQSASGAASMTQRIAFGDKVYGVLTVLLPRRYACDIEEQELFEEVANDLGFALHRVESAEFLNHSEKRLASIFRVAPVGIGIVSDRVIGEVNDRLCAMVGYSRDELVGQSARILYPSDEDYEFVGREKYRQIRLRGTGTVETRFRRKDGTILNVLLSSSPMNPEHPNINVTFTALDITERKHAEAEAERLTAAIEQAGEIVVITDPEGQIQYVNPAFERTTGYRRDEAIGRNPRLLKSGEQDDAFYERLWQTIASGASWEGRLVNKRKDGTLYTEEANISPVTDEAGRVVNYVAVKRDISEELALEEQYRQSQKMESVGRLAGGVAHDFNNMLNVILGHAEIALENLHGGEALRESIEEISAAARRSADLTRQLLAFARRQPVSPRSVDLNTAIEGMLSMLRRLIGESIELTWRPQEGVWPVRVDPSQLDQILANLCVNARDAITGSGKIAIEARNRTFSKADSERSADVSEGEFVMLSVTDDGKGMDEETRRHVFEPFYTTKETGRGTGLGLSTVYGIARQNGGFINVYTEPGEGTCFKIYLPRCTETPAVASPQIGSEEAKPVAGGQTILLVEDEGAILSLTARMIRKMGYRPLEADSPEKAIAVAREHTGPIHLIATDMVMPRMNGRELADAVAQWHPEAKRLFMSGYSANTIGGVEGLDVDAAFVQKPFSMEDLQEGIRQALAE